MDKEKLQEWLSTIAEAVKILIKYKDFDENICTTTYDKAEQHIYRGARKIAATLGLELHEKPWKCEGATATYISFEYEGVTFYELENYMKGEE